jgi:predicted O-methyltransferase YrrM
MNKSELLERVQPIDGWLSDSEAWLLFNLARNCPPNHVIVEIGSYKGKPTTCLALGSRCGAKVAVYAIDPHTGSPEHIEKHGKVDTFHIFESNVLKAGIAEFVRPVLKFSQDATVEVKEPIGLLFIDGAHEHEAVTKDFRLWFPKLAQNGVIAFHDAIWWKGVTKAVSESIVSSTSQPTPFSKGCPKPWIGIAIICEMIL